MGVAGSDAYADTDAYARSAATAWLRGGGSHADVRNGRLCWIRRRRQVADGGKPRPYSGMVRVVGKQATARVVTE